MIDASPSWLTFLSVYLLGLGLNLTPCVYPMLSVTLSLFKGSSTSSKQSPFLRALVYVLGMATMYSLLGVSAALTGGFFGEFLQNRWVLLGVAALFFTLALSMLGVYTFQLPSVLLARVGARHGTGFLGLYLSGLFVGVFAAPCIGPPIVALATAVGSQGDPLFAFQVFFVMSLGLGTPYLLLGTFSDALHKVPRSGSWLVWVERFFGVILLNFSAFYVLTALDVPMTVWLLPAALVLGGLYLGFFERSEAYGVRFQNFKKTMGILAVAVGVVLALLMPREKIDWEPYTPARLEQARAEAKPVVLDFFANWCIPCHELEQFTYTDPKVKEALAPFVRLKIDLTDPSDPAIDELMERLEVIGVPTVIFLNAQGEEIADQRITGFVSAEEMLQIIRSLKLSASPEST